MEDFNATQELEIFFVDDDETSRRSMSFYFQGTNITLFSFVSAEEALLQMQRREPDIIIADYGLPGMNGLQFFSLLGRFGYDVGKILISNHGDRDLASEATRLGVHDTLSKPISARSLSSAIQKIIVKEKCKSEEGARSSYSEDSVTGMHPERLISIESE